MGKSNIAGGNGKLDTLINGVIEQYTVAAGEEINAGDFVSYITNSLPEIINSSSSTIQNILVTMISNNSVLITYGKTDDGNLYAIICNVTNNSNMQYSSEILLFSDSSNPGLLSKKIIKISNNKFLLTMAQPLSYIRSMVFTCNNDMSITTGTITEIDVCYRR